MLTDGGVVDRSGAVDPHGMEGSGQEVSLCGGRGEAAQDGWHRRGERRRKRHTKEEKKGIERMPLATDYPTCRVIASLTHKRCQESSSTETWGINISDPTVNTH